MLGQDSSKNYSLHFQSTIIPQYHPNFNSPYSDELSFKSNEPIATSLTITGYLTYKYKNTYISFDPEASGGKGLSKTQGIAGFVNGEIYRVGSPKLSPYIARIYIEQRFPLDSKKEDVDEDQNIIKEYGYKNYISIIGGKFSLTDFLDNSKISHDPRTQFLNWSIMGDGSWDYPANTRGYTEGLCFITKYNSYFIKYANVAMPNLANGANMKWNNYHNGQVIEISKEGFHLLKNTDNDIHIGIYKNISNMGNYELAISLNKSIDSLNCITTKTGYYIGVENHYKKTNQFFKTSWNDGKNESWCFTEIDKSITIGNTLDGSLWKRNNDCFGIAYVKNDISDSHKKYLASGHYGFIIGDGKLINYGSEQILETYYSIYLVKILSISFDYQYIINPAYNKDRGPINVFGIRFHFSK